MIITGLSQGCRPKDPGDKTQEEVVRKKIKFK